MFIEVSGIDRLAVFLQGVHLFDITDVEQQRAGAEKRQLKVQEQPFSENRIHQHPGSVLVAGEDVGVGLQALDDALFDQAALAGVGDHRHVADRFTGQDARQQVLAHAVFPLHPLDGDAQLILDGFGRRLDDFHLFRRNRDIPGHRIDIGRIPCGDVVGAEDNLLGAGAAARAGARSRPGSRGFLPGFTGAQAAQQKGGRQT